MNIFQTLPEILKENANYPQALSPVLNQSIELFTKAHIYYRTFKYEKLMSEPYRLRAHPAIYGAALHLIGDYTSVGSYAINLALTIKCAQDLLREYETLHENYQELWQAIRWQYPLYEPTKWPREEASPHRNFSPSWSLYFQVQVVEFAQQITRISNYALVVFKQMFHISMCLCDAYLLFNGDSRARYDACTELVGEWERYQTELNENQKRLLEEIEKNQDLADSILSRLGTGKNIHSILNELKKSIAEFVEGKEEILDDFWNALEGTIDSFYIPGKITPLHVELSIGQVPLCNLPYGQFPPWGGQKITLIISKSQNSISENVSPSFNHLKKTQEPFFTNAIKGVMTFFFK